MAAAAPLAMEPTKEVMATWTKVGQIAEWAGLEVDSCLWKAVFGALGATPDTAPRFIGALTEDDFTAAFGELKLPAPDSGGEALAPSPVQWSMVGLLGLGCRLACGSQRSQAEIAEAQRRDDERREQQHKRDLEMKQIELQIAQAAAAAGAPAAAPGQLAHAGPDVKKVKISAVLDQGDDSEVALLTPAKLAEAYAAFEQVNGGPPAEAEELTLRQVSALHSLFASGGAPYVDFSIWGPFENRTARRLKFSGVVMQADGSWHAREIFGPPTYEAWDKAYTVFRAGAIMLQQMSLATLDAYRRHIKLLNDQYPASWDMVYEADVRCRLELVERVRRDMLTRYATEIAAGDTKHYDPSKPWDRVWREALADMSFWQREVHQPAMIRILHRGRGGPADDQPAAGRIGGGAPPPAPKPKATPKPKSAPRVHHVGAKGWLTTNRRNHPLCAGFQDGSCTAVTGSDGVCAVDRRCRHQCAKCLQLDHGAGSCTREVREPAWHKKLAKGGDKGSGKGKGKPGGKQQH